MRAISATVPGNIIKTRDLTQYYTEEAIEKFISVTGVEERRFADDNTCSSDLCYQAAEQLFEETVLRREDVDALIYVTETPDYKIPGTSVLLQDRLQLKTDTLVYDLNMACGGFIQSLFMAYTYLSTPFINNVLVLIGDTLSKIISLQDMGTGKLMGDAGTAIWVSKGEQFGNSFFSVHTDGSCLKSVYIPSGAFRNPTTIDTLRLRKYDDGSIRNEEQIAMIGEDVFGYAISKLPKDIKRLLEFANVSIEQVDKYAFHQANHFMTAHIAKKAKADMGKLLKSIHKYGNTAGTSIPLCMVENRDKINAGDIILMNAIGAGFTYGTVLLNIADCQILNIKEYKTTSTV